MKIERLRNDQGKFRCFEVSNLIISRTGMYKVIQQLKGVAVTHAPKFRDVEVFCEFEFEGHKFEMSEPYGDSSVYDVVGSEEAESQMEAIASHFEKASPITGGDASQRFYFLFMWLVRVSFFALIGYAIWSLFGAK